MWKGLSVSQLKCTFYNSIQVLGSVQSCCTLYPTQKLTVAVTDCVMSSKNHHFELQGRDVSDWMCRDCRDRKETVLQLTGRNFPLQFNISRTLTMPHQKITRKESVCIWMALCILKCQLQHTIYFSKIGEDGGIKRKLVILVIYLKFKY